MIIISIHCQHTKDKLNEWKLENFLRPLNFCSPFLLLRAFVFARMQDDD
jgi:hypothetical protein